MKLQCSVGIIAAVSGPVLASETRELDAHEHGVGQLNIAFDGSQVAMELEVPGADIVGFEYKAKSAEDRAAVDAAVAALARPLELFVLPAAAECSVVQASAVLESEHEEEDHEEHAHEDKHEEHADDEHAHEDEHDEHAHEEHAHEDEHEEHAHEAHDDHDHDEHAEAGGHTEFHAEYLLNCADTTAIETVAFAYFESFPNAEKLEVQVISGAGASAFDVVRDAPSLDLRGMF